MARYYVYLDDAGEGPSWAVLTVYEATGPAEAARLAVADQDEAWREQEDGCLPNWGVAVWPCDDADGDVHQVGYHVPPPGLAEWFEAEDLRRHGARSG